MSKRIGILTSTMSSYFVKRMAMGMHEALIGGDVELKTYEVHGKTFTEKHKFIESVATEEKLSGLIYGHLRLSANEIARFKMRNIPVVAVTERMPGIDWIAVDEMQGAYLGTRHLLELGHRRLALLNGPVQLAQAQMREDGFLKALDEFGIEFGRDKNIRVLNFTETEGKDAAHLLMGLALPPTGIFVAAGDVAALGVLSALRELKKQVPEEVSVVGFDNLEFAHYIYPKLTTVNQPLEEMGAWAVKRMMERLADPYAHRPYEKVLEPSLVRRESAAEMGGHASLLESISGFD